MKVLNIPAKTDAVRAMLECGWKAKITKAEGNHLYSAYRNDKMMAFIDIACFDTDPEYIQRVPISFKSLQEYFVDLLMSGPVILAVLLGTECRFIEIKNIEFNTKDLQMIDDELCLMIKSSEFKFVGKVIPIAETQYANQV